MILRFLLAATFTLAAGCGDDDHEHDLSAECQAIVDACHEVDTGEGRIAECHASADRNDEEFCSTEQQDCVETCEAAE